MNRRSQLSTVYSNALFMVKHSNLFLIFSFLRNKKTTNCRKMRKVGIDTHSALGPFMFRRIARNVMAKSNVFGSHYKGWSGVAMEGLIDPPLSLKVSHFCVPPTPNWRVKEGMT